MNLLALSDSDVIALSILSVGLAAFSVLVGGLFWILFKHGRKARFEAKIYEGLEDFSDEEGQAFVVS